MRIDKFLKNSRIIKRRTVAKEACDKERVFKNGKVMKASDEVCVCLLYTSPSPRD